MKNNTLYILWGAMFVLCAACGFVPEPAGALRVFLTVLALAFFVPPALLLYRAVQEKNASVIGLMLWLSASSLVLTLVVMVTSIATAMGSARLGNFLHGVLAVVSTPMLCSGHWALSLFLWACILMVSLRNRKK